VIETSAGSDRSAHVWPVTIQFNYVVCGRRLWERRVKCHCPLATHRSRLIPSASVSVRVVYRDSDPSRR